MNSDHDHDIVYSGPSVKQVVPLFYAYKIVTPSACCRRKEAPLHASPGISPAARCPLAQTEHTRANVYRVDQQPTGGLATRARLFLANDTVSISMCGAQNAISDSPPALAAPRLSGSDAPALYSPSHHGQFQLVWNDTRLATQPLPHIPEQRGPGEHLEVNQPSKN